LAEDPPALAVERQEDRPVTVVGQVDRAADDGSLAVGLVIPTPTWPAVLMQKSLLPPPPPLASSRPAD
jgi:hypothetical protein